MGAAFAIGVSTMGAAFAIGVSTMGAGFAIGAAAVGAGFAIGAAAVGVAAIGATAIGVTAIGATAIGAGFATGASAIRRGVGPATFTFGVRIGVGFGFGLEVASFGKLGIATFASAGTGAAGSFVMCGISNDRVPLAVRLGSAGICFHRGTFVAAAAGEATTVASTL